MSVTERPEGGSEGVPEPAPDPGPRPGPARPLEAPRRAPAEVREPAGNSAQRLLSPVQNTVVLLVLAVYIGSLGLLFHDRADPNWDRALFLLSGLEGLVFPAAALVFGAALGREQAEKARVETHEARQDAYRARARAAAFAERAAVAQDFAEVLEAEAKQALADRDAGEADGGAGAPNGDRGVGGSPGKRLRGPGAGGTGAPGTYTTPGGVRAPDYSAERLRVLAVVAQRLLRPPSLDALVEKPER